MQRCISSCSLLVDRFMGDLWRFMRANRLLCRHLDGFREWKENNLLFRYLLYWLYRRSSSGKWLGRWWFIQSIDMVYHRRPNPSPNNWHLLLSSSKSQFIVILLVLLDGLDWWWWWFVNQLNQKIKFIRGFNCWNRRRRRRMSRWK